MSAKICEKCVEYKKFCLEEMRRMEKELFEFQEICDKQVCQNNIICMKISKYTIIYQMEEGEKQKKNFYFFNFFS